MTRTKDKAGANGPLAVRSTARKRPRRFLRPNVTTEPRAPHWKILQAACRRIKASPGSSLTEAPGMASPCWHSCPHCRKDWSHSIPNPCVELDDYFLPCAGCPPEV